MAFLIRELLESGYLHADSTELDGAGMACRIPPNTWLDEGRLSWRGAWRLPRAAIFWTLMRPADNPFRRHGGLKLLTAISGRSVNQGLRGKNEGPKTMWVEAPGRWYSRIKER